MKRTLVVLSLCFAAAACNGSDVSNPSVAGGNGKDNIVKLDGLSSKAPATWKEGTPSSEMRLHQFMLPKTDGDPLDAELVVFFFGKGGGGDVDANVQRWKEKFAAPEGKRIDDMTKVEKLKVAGVGVVYVDISGIYLFSPAPMAAGGKKERRPDHRMIGVIFETPNGPYFMTLIGPTRTVESHKKGFDEWLKNFK